jgi:type IV pilus assembly protein PilE
MQGVSDPPWTNGPVRPISGNRSTRFPSDSPDHLLMQRAAPPPLGFTLIEMMVVVVVIGILAAVALPNYFEFVRKGRRADALDAISMVQQEQERFRSQSLAFAGTFSDLRLPQASKAGHYDLALSDASTLGYTLTVTAKAGGKQAADGDCKSFTVVVFKASFQRSAKDAGGADSTAKCWPQ